MVAQELILAQCLGFLEMLWNYMGYWRNEPAVSHVGGKCPTRCIISPALKEIRVRGSLI